MQIDAVGVGGVGRRRTRSAGLVGGDQPRAHPNTVARQRGGDVGHLNRRGLDILALTNAHRVGLHLRFQGHLSAGAIEKSAVFLDSNSGSSAKAEPVVPVGEFGNAHFQGDSFENDIATDADSIGDRKHIVGADAVCFVRINAMTDLIGPKPPCNAGFVNPAVPVRLRLVVDI